MASKKNKQMTVGEYLKKNQITVGDYKRQQEEEKTVGAYFRRKKAEEQQRINSYWEERERQRKEQERIRKESEAKTKQWQDLTKQYTYSPDGDQSWMVYAAKLISETPGAWEKEQKRIEEQKKKEEERIANLPENRLAGDELKEYKDKLKKYKYADKVQSGNVDKGSWLGNATNDYKETVKIENAKDFRTTLNEMIKNKAFDDEDDIELWSPEKRTSERAKYTQQAQDQQSKIDSIKQQIEEAKGNGGNRWDSLTDLLDTEEAQGLRNIINSQYASEPAKAEAQAKLNALLNKNKGIGSQSANESAQNFLKYNEKNLTTLRDNMDMDNMRRMAYDAINGNGAYEKATANLSKKAKQELDDRINLALDYVTDENGKLGVQLRTEQAKLENINDAIKTIDGLNQRDERYSQLMQNKATGDTAYHQPVNIMNPESAVDVVYYTVNGGLYSDDENIFKNEYMESMMMLSNEKDYFNTLYNAGKKNEAWAFYEGLQPYLNKAYNKYETLSIESNARRYPVISSIVSAAANVLQPMEYIANLPGRLEALFSGKQNAQTDPNSGMYSLTRIKTNIRNQVSQDLGDWGWVYNGAMSGVDSALNVAIARGIGLPDEMLQAGTLGVFYTQAFETSLQNTMSQGNDPFGYDYLEAFIDSAIEVATEVWSVENWLAEPTNLLKYVGKIAISEPSEEIVGAIVEPYIKQLIGHKNEYNERAKQILADGGYWTEENGKKKWIAVKDMDAATRQAMREWNHDIRMAAQEALVSVAPSIAYGGLRIAGQNRQIGRAMSGNAADIQAMMEKAAGMGEETDSAKGARKILDMLSKGKKVSNTQLGQTTQDIVRESGTKIAESEKAERQAQIEKTLQDKGVGAEEAKNLAKTIEKALELGGIDKLSSKERSAINANEAAVNALYQFKLNNQLQQDVYKAAEERNPNESAAKNAVSELLKKNINRKASIVKQSTDDEIRQAEESGSKRIQGNREAIVYDKKTGNGSFANVEGFEVVKKGKRWELRVKVKTADGQITTVRPSDITVTDYRASQIITAAANLPELYSDNYTQLLLKSAEMDLISGDNLDKTLRDAMMVRMLARGGQDITSLKLSIDSRLAELIKSNAIKEREQDAERLTKEAKRWKNPNITYGNAVYGSEEWTKATAELDEETRNWMDAIAGIAQRAGIDVSFRDMGNDMLYGMEGDIGGKRNGIALNVRGQNYVWDPKTKKAVRTDTKHHMLVTFGHELTHWLQRHSKDGYSRLEQFVLQTYISENSAEELTNRIKNRMIHEGESLADAISEIVAESCDQILFDEEVRDHIAQTDGKLFTEIKNFVKDLVDRFKKAVLGMSESQSYYARQMANHMNELRKMYLGAYDEALSQMASEDKAQEAETDTRKSEFNVDNIQNEEYNDNNEEREGINDEERAYSKAERIRAGVAELLRQDTRWDIRGTAALRILKGNYPGIITKGQKEYYLFREALSGTVLADQNGNPLIWLHGTDKEFSVFDIEKIINSIDSHGAYFTNSYKVADKYAGKNVDTKHIYPAGVYSQRNIEFTAADFNHIIEAHNYALGLIQKIHNLAKTNDGENILDLLPDEIYRRFRNKFGKDMADYVYNYLNKHGDIETVTIKDAAWDNAGINDQLIVFDTDRIIPATKEFWKNNRKEIEKGINQRRFSKAQISENIDETQDLIAYHNLTADQLMKVLRLGGFAMPSIGITRDNYVNDRYGDISVVFNKDTIDPRMNRLNKVFGGDAWTPTYPSVEYKVNSKKLSRLMNRIDQLVESDRQIDRVNLYMENLEKEINSARGDVVQAVKRYDLLKQAYIADKGIKFDTPMREKRLGSGTRLDNNEIIRAAEALGEETVRQAYENGYDWIKEHPEIQQTIIDVLNEQKMKDLLNRVQDEEKAQRMFEALKETEEKWGYGRLDSVLGAMYRYFKNGVEQEVDEYALRDKMNEVIDEADYEAWLQDELDGIIEKKGIRNNKDYFTNNGNRRSWEALHDEETLENVVRVMKEQDAKGANTLFNQSAILALGTKDFKSINDIRKNKGQLKHISEEEMSAAKTDIVNRFGALADDLTKDVKGGMFEQLEARDNVRSGIVDALRRTRTANGIRQSMKQWNYNLTEEQAQEIVDLMEEISNLPTEYFEAKPQRAVGLNEIARVLVPQGTSEELLDALAEQGIEVEYYDGTTEDRLAKMQAMDDVKFSKYTPDSMDVQTWMRQATYSTFQTEDERALWEAYHRMRNSMDLSLKKQLEYQSLIKTLESKADQLTKEQRDDLMAAKNRLKKEKEKYEKLQDELLRITTGEGYANMMYRNNMIFKDFAQGKTHDQVRQAVEGMLKLVQQTQEQIRKDTEELKQLSQAQAVKTMKSFMGKSSLSQMATNLRKAYNSTMSKAEIENRLAEMVLKSASGQDITADTEALAQDLMDKVRGIRSEALESLRGQTLIIGQETLNQLKAENSSLREIRNKLKGSGVTIKTEQNSRLDEQWAELRENNQALPNIDDVAADIDKLHTIVDFISGELEASRGANQYNLDMDEVAAMVRASVGNVTTYLSGDANARAQINNLMKQIAELSQKTEKTTANMEALEKQLDDVILAGQKAKGWTTILQRDVAEAIRYYNKTAKVAAQVEKNEVRKKLIETLKSQHTRDLIEQQEKYKEMMRNDKKARELAQDNQVLRRKISTVATRMANRIFAETDQKNVPEETKPLVRQVLDMMSKYDSPDENESFFRKVTYWDKQQVENIRLRLMKMIAANGAFNPDTDLDWLVIRAANEEDNDYELRDRAVQDLMDIEMGLLEYRNAEGRRNVTLQDRKNALEKVQKAISQIWNMVQARGEAEIRGRKWQVYELAEMLEADMQNSRFKGERKGFGRKARNAATSAVNYGNLTPEYFFKNLKNQAMSLLHSGLHDAENRSGLEALKAKIKMQQIAEETGFANWDGQEKHKIKVKGGTVEATTEQIMALYATWLREQNQLRPEDTAHLLHGGFVLTPNDMEKGKPRREKIQQMPILMSKEDLNALGSYLTEEQRAYVNAVVAYMSGELAELGNEASMKMYGIKKFTEQYYFPIKSWGGVLNSRSDAGVNSNNENRAAQQGFSKRVKANASNAIQISDFTPTAMKHIAGMITYNTIAPAVENMNKVLNQQFSYGEMTDEEGNTYKPKRNIRAAFQENYGKQAYDYMTQFIKDVNGGVSSGYGSTIWDKLLGVFKKSAVAGSLSVAAQQPLSYIRAAMMINPKYLTKALVSEYWKGAYQEMLNHSGVAVIKNMGKFDMNYGQSMVDYVTPEGMKSKGKATWDWINDKSTALPGKMDDLTWTRMWVAVKAEQHALHPDMDVKSEEFLNMVAERFNEVMRRTQVYDSVMVKSQNMRNPHPFAKTITSFMAEPTLSLNVLEDAWMNKGEKGGKKNAIKALVTFMMSAAAQAMVKAFFSTGRTPDKKKTELENYLYRLSYNLINEANPLGLVAGYSNLVDLLMDGELTDNSLSVVGKAKDILTALKGMIKGGEGLNWYRNIEDSLGQILQLATNIPAKNAMRDFRALMNIFSGGQMQALTGGTYANRETSAAMLKYQTIDLLMKEDLIGLVNKELENAGWKTDTKSYYSRIYTAEKTGNQQAADEMKEYVVLNSKAQDPEKNMNDALRKLADEDDSMSSEEKLKVEKEYGLKDTTGFVLDEYRDGKLTRKQAEEMYKKEKPDVTKEKLAEPFDKIDYEKKTGTKVSNWSNYIPLYDAISNNKSDEIKNAVNHMIDIGYTKKRIQDQIKDKYKQTYLDAKGDEKRRLKDALTKAYKATGLTAAEALKIIDGWKPTTKKK